MNLRLPMCGVATVIAVLLLGTGCSHEQAGADVNAVEEPSAPTAATEQPTQDIHGSISYLNFVGFRGGIEGIMAPPPKPGTGCAESPAYADVSPGAAVTIEDGLGTTLATVPLTAFGTVTKFRESASERDKRADLIDIFYDLRISKTRDELEIARLNYQRSLQRLYDVKHPKDWGFEGHQFFAVWCRLDFEAPDLETADNYTLAIGARAPMVVKESDLIQGNGALDLFFD